MTPEELYSGWKSTSEIETKNGWVFRLGKSRNTGLCADQRVQMFIGFNKEVVERQLGVVILQNTASFDSLFFKGQPFWGVTGLTFIDFDDCFIESLKDFLLWCESHSPLYVLNMS